MSDLTTFISENSFAVFVLYLVIASNFLAPLFSCRLRESIESSMVIRHVLGFLTLTFFVVLANKTKPLSFKQVMVYSGFFYAWFVLSTRIHIEFWLIIIALLGAIYLIHLYQSDLTSDVPTDEEDKFYKQVKMVLSAIAGVITIVGVVIYLGEKQIEYDKNFSYANFVLGAPDCRGKSPKVGFTKSLKRAFGL